jgi:hypothetical protein
MSANWKDNYTQAYALKIGDRWFNRFISAGRVQTAWSLAGAALFMLDDERTGLNGLAGVEARLTKRGKAFTRVLVGVQEVPDAF